MYMKTLGYPCMRMCVGHVHACMHGYILFVYVHYIETVCVYMCMHVYTCVCTHAVVCTHACMCVYGMYMCMHVC